MLQDSDDVGSTVSEDTTDSSTADYREEVRPIASKPMRDAGAASDKQYTGGAHTASYETFVQSLFNTGAKRLDPNFALNSFNGDFPVNNVPASVQLKLDAMSNDKPYAHSYSSTPFAPYSDSLTTKDAYTVSDDGVKLFAGDREYLNRYRFRSEHMRNLHDAREKEFKDGKKKIMLDYKKFRSSPLSPHLYSGDQSSYVHDTDSRIIGSDFVMLTLRPNDNFMNKIDKTLAEARKVNSWDM